MSKSQTIADLQARIAELEREVKKKDEIIKYFETHPNSSAESEIKSVDSAIYVIIEEIQSEEHDNNNETLNEQMKSIIKEPNAAKKVFLLRDLMKYDADSKINRLCAQLEGHVEFLTHLAANPDLQSLFLISNYSGKVLLPETARRLLLDQAARTTQLLVEFKKEDPEKSPFGDVDEILRLNVDPTERLQQISKFLEHNSFEYDELVILLRQEIMISGALRRYAGTLMQRLVDQKKKTKHSTKHEKSRSPKQSIIEENDKKEEVFELLKEALDKKASRYTEDSLLDFAAELASDVIAAKEEAGINEKDLCSYLVKSRKRILQLESNNSANEWAKWARKLYKALTLLDYGECTNSDLRICIEEAALTSVGTPVLHNRISSLRLQKKALIEQQHDPFPEAGDASSLKAPIDVSVAISRMQRMSGNCHTLPQNNHQRKHRKQ